MKNPSRIAFRLWFHTWIILNTSVFIYDVFTMHDALLFHIFFLVISFLGSFPALLIYIFVFPFMGRETDTNSKKLLNIMLLSLGIALIYGFFGAFVFGSSYRPGSYFEQFMLCSGVLCASSFFSVGLNKRYLYTECFSQTDSQIEPFNQPKNKNMETYYSEEPQNTNSNGNKALIKGLVTGGLILAMLIPTLFITGLVSERQQRQQEVVKEVSSKWAGAQTVTAPYLYIPYYNKDSGDKNKPASFRLVLLPDNLEVNGEIIPEQRLRSIYKVRLYKTQLNTKGNFVLQLPKDIDASALALNEAKICVGITDFKGIEKKIDVRVNNHVYTLYPGLPTDAIDSVGLSAPIDLATETIAAPISFDMSLSLKGSEQLHFVPLSGNSQFNIRSAWADPSFDGNTIPSDRTVTDAGFSAKWTFNKANLPFGTLLRNEKINKAPFAFGISMLQPADQYAKTTRSVKYAILFIGLTFSLFFIIELMQKKPVHPVQYILVGLALVIFYTLLLAISEFVLFDWAYLIAASATISLITLYAKSHFQSWKTAAIFGSVLSGLYAFIFVLIRLEDTALLVGSIGLFIVLAAVMYASRKINWYEASGVKPVAG